MPLNVCPGTTVASPVGSVWELLAEPELYDEWWDAFFQRAVPPGKASPGQVLYAKASQWGFVQNVTLQVEQVDPERHLIQFTVYLPFGTINRQTTTCTALDSATCRLQFG